MMIAAGVFVTLLAAAASYAVWCIDEAAELEHKLEMEDVWY